MSKLFRFKEWLTVGDAARHLSTVFGEEVTEADVLRFGLDGYLKLSVHLVNEAYARPCVPVRIEEIEWLEVPSLNGNRTVQIPKNGRVWQDERGAFQVLTCIVPLESAVWDLPMTGGERIDIEHRYQQVTGGPEVTAVSLDGIFVAATSGALFEIQSHYEDNPYFDKSELKQPLLHFENFHPAGALPRDCVVVVRTKALVDFQKRYAEDQDKTLSTRERDTLLRLIIGMAICGYGHDPSGKRNSAPREISEDLGKLGMGVSDDTIRNYLKEAANTVLPAGAQHEQIVQT